MIGLMEINSMKKIFIVLISLLLLFALTGIADAQETTTTKDVTGESDGFDTGTSHDERVLVTLTISQSFTVKIPDVFVLTKDENGYYSAFGTVSGQITLLDSNEKLVVTVSGSDYVADGSEWILKADGTKSEKYQMALHDHVVIDSPNNLESGDMILEIPATDLTQHTAELHLKLVEMNPPVGEYQDELTFTVSIEEVSNP